ncbi:protein kinase [Strigomonas culicis]|nr:protein kinase [Strigomonas culicis]|eukprot:EPY19402.1 protein kinase [Strigomonas culicis]
MWSCGCILFFMLCGYLPFTDQSDGLTRKRILSNQYNRRNKFLTTGAADLIEKLLERDPNKRYTTSDVISDPWFVVDLDPTLFPNKGTVSPASPSFSGEFIQRAITPQDAPAALTTSPTLKVAGDLHQAFTSCNITGDGYLNKEEVRDALIKLNGEKEVSDREVTEFMNHFKLDKDGRITEEEFVIGWTNHQNELGQRYNLGRMANLFHYDLEKEFLAHVRVAFDVIDKEHTGVLTKESFMNLNIGMSRDDAQTLFDVVDKDKEGVSSLTFERFVLLCMSYDLLRNHPLLIRLRRLEDIFALTEPHSLKSSMSTGYIVAGARDQIKAQLMMKGPQLETKFEPGDMNGFLYGAYSPSGKKTLEVGVKLLPAVAGYTKVIAYRILGKTTDFRDWLLLLRKNMKDELLKYEEDTAVRGEAELM